MGARERSWPSGSAAVAAPQDASEENGGSDPELFCFLRRAGLEGLLAALTRGPGGVADLAGLLAAPDSVVRQIAAPREQLQQLRRSLAVERGNRSWSFLEESRDITRGKQQLRRSPSASAIAAPPGGRAPSPRMPSPSRSAASPRCAQKVEAMVSPETRQAALANAQGPKEGGP